MSTQLPSRPSQAPGPGRRRPPGTSRWLQITLTVAVVVAVLALVALLVVVLRGGGTSRTSAVTSSQPAASATAGPTAATTSVPSPTAVTTIAAAPPAQVDPAAAVWPVVASPLRYADPVEAARGFAVDFAGFQAPVIGAFQPGDGRSGEVEVRPTANGPATTVFVRRLEDGNWWVLGAATPQIRLDTPATGDLVGSPLRLTGAAQAFEGHVTVTVREDGAAEPLGTGYVTGRTDAMGPFDGQVTFARAPHERYGALLLTVLSAANGEPWQAAVIRLRFLR